MKTHKDLFVWQESVDFVTDIYRETSTFPKREMYGIIQQLRKAAVSIRSNISEGAGRNGVKQFRHFLFIALGSNSEIEVQLIVAKNLGFLSQSVFEELSETNSRIGKMLTTLIKSLNSSNL